jgi:uncharacterized membrane protein YuzA (DUF378 family)
MASKISNTTFGLILYILVLVGALNWGLIGAFNVNLVDTIIPSATLERIVYILVGVSALILVISRFSA